VTGMSEDGWGAVMSLLASRWENGDMTYHAHAR
jgi:hypothetical protein